MQVLRFGAAEVITGRSRTEEVLDRPATAALDRGHNIVEGRRALPGAPDGGTVTCMHTDDSVPTWVREIPPGTFDCWLLDQSTYWVTESGKLLRVEGMSKGHLEGVVRMLEARALQLHFYAMAETFAGLLDCDGGQAELLAIELGGSSISDATPGEWLATTALMRALQRALRTAGRP